MKVCKNVTEFYKINDKDLTNLIISRFKNVISYYPIEDLKADIYERLHRKKYIENYRPFDIGVDMQGNSWTIKPAPAKFSTYICKFVFNYVYAYFNKVDPDSTCLSLDDYKDNCFSKENNTKLKMKDTFNPDLDTNLHIQAIESHLKKMNFDTGTIICNDGVFKNILKVIDGQGNKGCSREYLIDNLGKGRFTSKSLTSLEDVLISSTLENIEKRKIIKSKRTTSGETVYYINEAERRSIYNLFKHYVNGYKDKEISEKFKMTVAGVGALKRNLRKELKIIYNA